MARFPAHFLPLAALALAAAAALAGPHPSLPPAGTVEGLGVNIHFTEPAPGELEMIRRTGFRWVRMDLVWAATEKQPGTYDFAAYDGLAAGLARAGLKALFILDYSNKLYSPDDRSCPAAPQAAKEFRAAYARWAAAAARHFAGRGYLWEIWNEPNIPNFWKPGPDVDAYAAMALEACRAIRATAPGEAIIGPATSGIDLAFLKTCFERGLLEWWDAVSVHPYRQSAPETAHAEYEALRRLIAGHAPRGREIPILAAEWGYSTAWKGFSDAKQAEFAVRQMLGNLAEGVPLTIWYDWRDDGDNPAEGEHRFGLVRRPFRNEAALPFEPKPSWAAVHALATRLDGLRFNKRLLLPDRKRPDHEAEVLLFSNKDKQQVVFLHQPGGAPEIPLPLAAPSTAVVRGIDGAEASRGPAGGRTLAALPSPVAYVEPDAPDDILCLAAAWPALPALPEIEVPAVLDIVLSFPNPLATPVRLEGRDKPVPAGQRIPCEVSSGGIGRLDLPEPGGRGLGQRVVAADLALAGGPTLRQRVHVHVRNPIGMEVATPGPAGLPLVIVNPSGDPWQATVCFQTANGTDAGASHPVEVGRGARETVVVQPVPPAGATLAEIREPQGPPVRFPLPRPLAGFEAAHLKTWTEGDKAVASEASLAVADGPDASCPSGGPSVRLDYRFGEGWSYAPVEWQGLAPDQRPVAPDHADAYCLWVHGDGQGVSPRIRLMDQAGQTFQFTGPDIDWRGWRFVAIPLDPARAGHWGGPDDGRVQPPLRLYSPILLDPGRRPLAGRILVAAPAWRLR